MTDQERLDNITPIGYRGSGDDLEYLLKGDDFLELQQMAQKFIDQAELLERYKQALEFYADEDNWVPYEGTDEIFPGHYAREALKGESE